MLQEEVPQNALQCGKRHIHRGTSYIDTNNTKNILEAVHMVVVNCLSSEPLPDSRFLTKCSTLPSYNITILIFIYFTEQEQIHATCNPSHSFVIHNYMATLGERQLHIMQMVQDLARQCTFRAISLFLIHFFQCIQLFYLKVKFAQRKFEFLIHFQCNKLICGLLL